LLKEGAGMDSTTLLLIIVPLFLGLIFNAVRFMRFIGFLTGARRRSSLQGLGEDSLLSFDERLAERLRQLERENRDRQDVTEGSNIPSGFGRRRA
jgi:hypothetical protein